MLIVSLLAVFLFIYGTLFSRLLPSALATHMGQACAIACAAIPFWLSRPDGPLSEERREWRFSDNWIVKRRAFRIPMLALIAGVISFTVVEHGLFSILAGVLGTPDGMILTITGGSSSRRGCSHFEVREMRPVFSWGLCGSWDDVHGANAGDRLRLHGRSSTLGFVVDGYDVLPASLDNSVAPH